MPNQRIRDPIHGLISFDLKDDVEKLAWEIVDTPEFQRLRHVRQLGVSELVFPGATHTRFAHSIGVFHNARKFMSIIKREEGDAFDPERAAISLLAALVHDVGHGPFSHAFESAREKVADKRGEPAIEKHEAFSARIIRSPQGGIWNVLKAWKGYADKIADLIQADDPIDIYHAVVSSSFDADRLDYLVRDRHMTGVESGSIDEDWLIDNLQKYEIPEPQDDDAPRIVPTFVFRLKGRQAAEDFLLARHRLYAQLYLHKTTRGFEKLIIAIIIHIAEHWDRPEKIGLDAADKFIRFLSPGGQTLENYLQLDDGVFWGTTRRLREFGDDRAQRLTDRLLNRKRLRVLDLSAIYVDQPEALINAQRRLDEGLKDKIDLTVFKDVAPNYLYGRVGGEATKAHKMVRVRSGNHVPKEILEFPDTIVSKWLTEKRNIVRYYFLDDIERTDADKILAGG